MGDLKLLHIGCGMYYHEGFVNSDCEDTFPDGKKKKVDLIMDISKPWPYEDESIDGIISMAVLQCLNWIQLYDAFLEMKRVLKKGAVMRHGVVLEETKQPLRRFLFGRNIQIFNFELFRSVLIDRIGFSEIELCRWRRSRIPQFIKVDCRHHKGTSYIEVVK